MTAHASVPAATDTRGRFVWHELMTNDLAAAEDFYGSVVGWTTQRSQMPGMEYISWMAGNVGIGGLMILPEEAKAMGAPPHWYAYMEVPDVDAAAARVTRSGGRVYAGPMTVDTVGRFAILADPQGANFAVIASATPLAPETDPAPLQFSWHELSTTDLNAAIAFYEPLFGWKKQSEMDMGGDMGPYYMFGRDRFTYGGMMKKAANNPAPPNWLHYALVKDSADAAAARATKAGATVMMGPMEVPGGDRVAVLIDPQGAAFGVHSKP